MDRYEDFLRRTIHLNQHLKYTYIILPLSNCSLSPGNGQLSKLHVNKAHFLSPRTKRKRSMSITIQYVLVEVYFKSEKSSYLSVPEKWWRWGPKGRGRDLVLFFRNRQIRGLSPIHLPEMLMYIYLFHLHTISPKMIDLASDPIYVGLLGPRSCPSRLKILNSASEH